MSTTLPERYSKLINVETRKTDAVVVYSQGNIIKVLNRLWIHNNDNNPKKTADQMFCTFVVCFSDGKKRKEVEQFEIIISLTIHLINRKII